MKKRILSLLCAFLFLFALPSCAQEYEYGTFYEENGILQNTHVTLIVENESLVAPVTELKYVLRDDFDFSVWYRDDERENSRTPDLLEVYSGGGWSQVGQRGGGGTHTAWIRSPQDPTERIAHHIKMRFVDRKTGGNGYIYLQPGFYRIRVQYSVSTDDENAYIPEGQLEAVAYFTVTAPEA